MPRDVISDYGRVIAKFNHALDAPKKKTQSNLVRNDKFLCLMYNKFESYFLSVLWCENGKAEVAWCSSNKLNEQ